MDMYTATEEAYKNGYARGYENGKRDAIKHGHKAASVISNTGFMCTVCYSDIDHDAVYCKYCGAKMDEDY